MVESLSGPTTRSGPDPSPAYARRRGSDVRSRAVVITELDVDGNRVLGKGCKTQQELDARSGMRGYFLVDAGFREHFTTPMASRLGFAIIQASVDSVPQCGVRNGSRPTVHSHVRATVC